VLRCPIRVIVQSVSEFVVAWKKMIDLAMELSIPLEQKVTVVEALNSSMFIGKRVAVNAGLSDEEVNHCVKARTTERPRVAI
jgi:hypothetical protein